MVSSKCSRSGMGIRITSLELLAVFLAVAPAHAWSQGESSGELSSSTQAVKKRHNLYRSWRRMADREEASEPSWLSPLATTSGRIKNEFRYDIWSQTAPTGSTISTFGGGKGLEFIAAPWLNCAASPASGALHLCSRNLARRQCASAAENTGSSRPA